MKKMLLTLLSMALLIPSAAQANLGFKYTKRAAGKVCAVRCAKACRTHYKRVCHKAVMWKTKCYKTNKVVGVKTVCKNYRRWIGTCRPYVQYQKRCKNVVTWNKRCFKRVRYQKTCKRYLSWYSRCRNFAKVERRCARNRICRESCARGRCHKSCGAWRVTCKAYVRNYRKCHRHPRWNVRCTRRPVWSSFCRKYPRAYRSCRVTKKWSRHCYRRPVNYKRCHRKVVVKRHRVCSRIPRNYRRCSIKKVWKSFCRKRPVMYRSCRKIPTRWVKCHSKWIRTRPNSDVRKALSRPGLDD